MPAPRAFATPRGTRSPAKTPFFQQAFRELVGLLAAELDGGPLVEYVDKSDLAADAFRIYCPLAQWLEESALRIAVAEPVASEPGA